MPVRIVQGVEELKTLTGQEVGLSDWLTIPQETITAFAAATGDHQWIHLDTERAKTESPYKSTIAHGFLTLSLLSELSRAAVDIQGDFKMRINYGLNRVRFPAPVPANSRVRGRFVLKAVEDLDQAAQIIWDCTIEVENQVKPAVAAEWLIRVYF